MKKAKKVVDLPGMDPVEEEVLRLPGVWNTLNVYRRQMFNEPGGGISQTVPNQVMSVREILQRFAAGLPVSGQRVPFYDDPEGVNDDAEGMPDLSRMDIEEVAELRRMNEDKIRVLNQKLKDDEKAKSEASLRAKEQANLDQLGILTAIAEKKEFEAWKKSQSSGGK